MPAIGGELQDLVTEYENCIRNGDSKSASEAKSSCTGKLNAAVRAFHPDVRDQLKSFLNRGVDRHRSSIKPTKKPGGGA